MGNNDDVRLEDLKDAENIRVNNTHEVPAKDVLDEIAAANF